MSVADVKDSRREAPDKENLDLVSQDACSGVWIMMAFGQALASRLMAALPRWSEPLSTITNTRGALA